MDLSKLASKVSPDGVVAAILGVLGVNSIIIGLVLVVMALQAWVGIARSTVARVPSARQKLVQVSQLPRTRILVAVMSTALVPVAQLTSLWLCYLVGNLISVLFDAERQVAINDLFKGHAELSYDVRQPWKIFDPALAVHFMRVMSAALEVDLISGIYVVAAAILVIRSYFVASRSTHMSEMSGIGTLLALPATGMMLLSGIPLAFAFVAAVLTNSLSEFSQFFPQLYGFLFFAVSFISFHASVRGSLAVVRAWRAPDAA